MVRKKVPKATINRLPLYLRGLVNFYSKGERVVSSTRLAELIGTNSAQVRKDLSFLGEFGIRGIGYEIEKLIEELSQFLGLAQAKKVIVVGVGRLGSALLGYNGFKERGFEIVAGFDVDPSKIGKEMNGVNIYKMDSLRKIVKKIGVDIGIITTPAQKAQEVAEKLVEAGVKSILNFAPVSIEVSDKIPVRNVDLSVEFQILSYYLSKGEKSIIKRGNEKRFGEGGKPSIK